jgi:PST family polysaccharide transporter
MKKLLENTVMLYLMNFTGYFFSLLTIPYQARILSQTYFGGLALAIGVMLYFQLIIDFGFMISAVTDIAKFREDKNSLNHIVSCVIFIRAVIALLLLLCLWILLSFVANYSIWSNVFYIYFLAIVLESLLPAFFLRGMEDMRTVALLTVCSKALMTSLIFLLVKSDVDYLIIPWSRVLGAAVSLFIAWTYIKNKYGIQLVKVSRSEFHASLVNSSGYFFSRVASSFYGGGNSAILGILFPSAVVALYASAEKILNVGMTLSSPIADSLLPYITKSKDFSTAWKFLKFLIPTLAIGGTISFIFAERIILLIFGDGYADAAPILRTMIPIIAFTLPNYVVAFPILVPMGLGKQSNMANVIGAIVYLFGTAICLSVGKMNPISAARILLISTMSVLLWRVGVLWHYRERLVEHSRVQI